MPNLNKVALMGNVTRDPEVKYTPKGTAVCEVGLAINRAWKDDSGQKKEEVTFVGVTFWGRLAEICGEYAKKGRPIYCEGRLTQESWDDKTTGKKVTKTKVVGESLQLLGGKPGGAESGERPQSRPPTAARPANAETPDDDDIPF
jgi:single-strand DNA-binding protein